MKFLAFNGTYNLFTLFTASCNIALVGKSCLKIFISDIFKYRSFIYPTDAQLDCSKNVKIYITVFHNHHQGATVCALLKL